MFDILTIINKTIKHLINLAITFESADTVLKNHTKLTGDRERLLFIEKLYGLPETTESDPKFISDKYRKTLEAIVDNNNPVKWEFGV